MFKNLWKNDKYLIAAAMLSANSSGYMAPAQLVLARELYR